MPKLIIRANETFVNMKNVKLKGWTAGNVYKILDLTIGVCGNETMSLKNPSPMYYTFRHAVVNGSFPVKLNITEYSVLDSLFEFNQN